MLIKIKGLQKVYGDLYCTVASMKLNSKCLVPPGFVVLITMLPHDHFETKMKTIVSTVFEKPQFFILSWGC